MVEPSHRGFGVFPLLLAEQAERARQRGKGGLMGAVLPRSKDSRASLESMGFDYRGRLHIVRILGRDFTFTRLRDDGEFLEWAVVFDNYYGTTRKPVEAALAAGRDVLFDVDWQGAASLRDRAKDDVVTVFILPPTAADLEQRCMLDSTKDMGR